MKVQMYTLSTCPWCRKTKRWFKDHGIPYDYVDYDLADDAEQERIRDEVMRHTDHFALPYVNIGGNVVVGYDPEKYEQALGRKQEA